MSGSNIFVALVPKPTPPLPNFSLLSTVTYDIIAIQVNTFFLFCILK